MAEFYRINAYFAAMFITSCQNMDAQEKSIEREMQASCGLEFELPQPFSQARLTAERLGLNYYIVEPNEDGVSGDEVFPMQTMESSIEAEFAMVIICRTDRIGVFSRSNRYAFFVDAEEIVFRIEPRPILTGP